MNIDNIKLQKLGDTPSLSNNKRLRSVVHSTYDQYWIFVRDVLSPKISRLLLTEAISLLATFILIITNRLVLSSPFFPAWFEMGLMIIPLITSLLCVWYYRFIVPKYDMLCSPYTWLEEVTEARVSDDEKWIFWKLIESLAHTEVKDAEAIVHLQHLIGYTSTSKKLRSLSLMQALRDLY